MDFQKIIESVLVDKIDLKNLATSINVIGQIKDILENRTRTMSDDDPKKSEFQTLIQKSNIILDELTVRLVEQMFDF